MRQIQFTANSDRASQHGFTVIELLVAMFLSAIIGTLITQVLAMHSQTYNADILRMRVQQNLRGALDILSMNVRQTGEGLDKNFPALLLSQNSGIPTMAVRRKLVSEVMTACLPIVANSNVLTISDVASTTPECLPVNIAASLAVWTAARNTAEDDLLRIYLYDRVAKTGEFVNYTSEVITNDGNNALIVAGPLHNYPARSTSIYVLEEYSFTLDPVTKTLQLTVNGKTDEPQDVAYKIDTFDVKLKMQDGTAPTTLAPTDVNTWKKIRNVEIALSGKEVYKSLTMTRAVKGQYLPRNVLSQ